MKVNLQGEQRSVSKKASHTLGDRLVADWYIVLDLLLPAYPEKVFFLLERKISMDVAVSSVQ